MKFLEKIVLKTFTQMIEQMSTSFNQSIQNLHSENKQLKEQLNELLEKYRILSEQVQKDSQKTATLLADYNTKKASSDAKYRTVINVLYSLNLKFSQNVSAFGKAKNWNCSKCLLNIYTIRVTISEKLFCHYQKIMTRLHRFFATLIISTIIIGRIWSIIFLR